MKNALFTKDGKWFLIPELPEKPDPEKLIVIQLIKHHEDVYQKALTEAIANALPVANPEIITGFFNRPLNEVEKDRMYQWPGTFDTLESLPPKALLILPTAERYYMKTENMTKALEVARTLPCACSDCGMRETESAKKILEFAESLTATGSVAAPKEEPETFSRKDVKNLMETVRVPMQEKIDTLTAIIQRGGEEEVRLLSELSSLRDQLREKDELIKEMAAGLIKAKKYVSEGADMFESAIDAQHTKQEFQNVAKSLDSLIKKSRKL